MSITLEDVAYRTLPRVLPGRALAHSEWLTLVAVAEVLVSDAPHGVSFEDIASNVDRFLVLGRSRRAWRVRVLMTLIEWLPVAKGRPRFSRLSVAERRTIVEKEWIAGTRLGRICAKVKNLVVLGAYGDGRAAAQTGYLPIERRARFRDASPSRADAVAPS
jgi:hypothetical protein